jgi:hypothetical protein
MQIIEFNGLGEPRDPRFGSGTIAILVQDASVSVVRVEVLQPDAYGPSLLHATNDELLEHAVQNALRDAFPSGLDPSRDWVLECPTEIAVLATFAGDGHA